MNGLKFPAGMKNSTIAQLFKEFHKQITDSNVGEKDPTEQSLLNRGKHPLSVELSILRIVTKIYLMEGYEAKRSIKNIAIESFNSDFENVKFSQKQKAARIINKWIETKTFKKIQRVISHNSLNEDTRMICINVIYFKGLWRDQFRLNEKLPFFLNENDSIEADFMVNNSTMYSYAFLKDMDVHALEMTYMDPEVKMIVLLPNLRCGLKFLENNLHKINFVALDAKFKQTNVDLTLPKFKIETDMSMNKALKNVSSFLLIYFFIMNCF